MKYRDLNVRWSRLLLGLGLVLGAGCGGGLEAVPQTALTRAGELTSTGQALSSTPPLQDPQSCVLPSGRYVISATVTNTSEVYNVTFLNDGVEGAWPSANCQTMRLVWDEGIPYPAIPPQHPAEADFPKRLLEGWWMNDASPKRFAVKAVWQTDDNLGVITQIAGTSALGYLAQAGDVPSASRFNWIGPGSDATHEKWFEVFAFGDASYGEVKMRITDGSNSFSHITYQSLSCQSGTARVGGWQRNCPQ